MLHLDHSRKFICEPGLGTNATTPLWKGSLYVTKDKGKVKRKNWQGGGGRGVLYLVVVLLAF